MKVALILSIAVASAISMTSCVTGAGIASFAAIRKTRHDSGGFGENAVPVGDVPRLFKVALKETESVSFAGEYPPNRDIRQARVETVADKKQVRFFIPNVALGTKGGPIYVITMDRAGRNPEVDTLGCSPDPTWPHGY